ncbi:L-ascorbate metabolism protein UlaG (beta-lactamase superfamily) [Lewinella aquimaris]|uniref:L-ascorbate metabolism protein UlaG (Beta-lactamase superfamily) n=1 Tax=Neolewinella aquimaris TaxID=1835722 RepID=A0A840DXC1_9BACT|nr:MBL fold metallo-hydrolase [Neolewinella aquimaris]MBB4077864.1 L-ascorbate metabolism protein UlaG (beta-lactamase superfamily) [Neolewinella aquimaris]
MRLSFYLLLCSCVLATSCNSGDGDANYRASEEVPVVEADSAPAEVEVHPIFHGSVVLTQGERTIFVDPYNGAERYTEFGAPDLVLITHTHPDHLDTATLSGLDLSEATLVAPQAVMDAMRMNPFAASHVLANGENWTWEDVIVTAVPAYNDPPKDNFHPKGKFNGYVVDLNGERYYFSGDTEGVTEMRALEDIDVAFVCMNLPYTMDIDQAASAVLDFAPAVVYPYHYRNQDETKSDVEAFKQMVNEQNSDIEVRLENWYPG